MENTSIETAEQLPQPLSDLLYDLTPKQRKFVLLLVHSEGIKSASQCAAEAGYSKKSSRELASRLQNPELYPKVAKAIDSELRANVERYKCTQERSLATLSRLRDAASTAGNFNAAVAAETRRGQIAGLYVDKKEILTGTIDSMSKEDVEKRLQELKEQYSIETTFEEIKELENKS